MLLRLIDRPPCVTLGVYLTIWWKRQCICQAFNQTTLKKSLNLSGGTCCAFKHCFQNPPPTLLRVTSEKSHFMTQKWQTLFYAEKTVLNMEAKVWHTFDVKIYHTKARSRTFFPSVTALIEETLLFSFRLWNKVSLRWVSIFTLAKGESLFFNFIHTCFKCVEKRTN